MRYLVAALAVGFAMPALSQEMVYRSGEVTVRLMKQECPSVEIAEILAQVSKPTARVAMVQAGSQDVPACWTHDAEKVYIVDVLGRAGYIGKESFRPEPGV